MYRIHGLAPKHRCSPGDWIWIFSSLQRSWGSVNLTPAQYTIGSNIINEWPNLPFVKRMKFVGALIHRVVFHRAAPSWIEMRIEWKEDITGWNFVDIAHIKITAGGGKSWSEEENIILSEMYPESTLQQMRRALPSRSWSSIQSRASAIGLYRKQGTAPVRPKNIHERSLSLQDYEYMREVGMANDTILYWSFL